MTILKRSLTALLVTAALGILISLGFWQLQRKAWKEALIADLGTRSHEASAPVPPRTVWPHWDAARDEFRHVVATGTYLPDKEISVYGLMPSARVGTGNETGSLQGAFLFTPLRLDDGSVVLVNRGFAPKEVVSSAMLPTSGPVRIEGILRSPEKRGWFVPENAPAGKQWYTRDSTAMAEALDIENAPPFYIEADAVSGAAPGSWPRGGLTREVVLKNDHLQYALTWFGLALTLVGVTGYALLRKSALPQRKTAS